MVDHAALDPETRSFALVGQFLWHWAYMEESLKNAIAAGLSLDDIQAHIVAKNIQFRDKVNILKGCISIALISSADKKRYIKFLVKLNVFSPTRNMVAHNLFGPDPDGIHIRFLRFKAPISFPDEKWDTETFLSKIKQIDDFTHELMRIEKIFKESFKLRSLVEALGSLHAAPSADQQGGLGLLDLLTRESLHGPPYSPGDETEPKGPKASGD